MGNCRSLQSASKPDDHPKAKNHLGRTQFSAGLSNARLKQNGDSTSRGCRSDFGGTSSLFGQSSSNNHTSGNNTSTSFWGSENSQASGVRDGEEFPHGEILNAPKLRVFTLAELRAATKNFRADRVVGEGGFGAVYKGLIRGEGLTIAIKKWNPGSSQGVAEWQSEVNLVGRLSHPNLVKLLGFRREDSELFLVYEFMHRGTLDNHLFGRGANVQPLSWATRLKVMIGAARGLNFLHSMERKIVHRDFKPSNILLDETFAAKLSDFGLAKSFSSIDQTHVSTRVMGTAGYAAPEYMATGRLKVKSDVYSFGIVLTEVLTGVRLRKLKSFTDWFKSNLLNRAKIRSTMDAKLEGKYPTNLALQVAQLALKCIQTDPKLRPSIKEVLERLEQIEAANEKPVGYNYIRRRVNRSKVVQQHDQPDGAQLVEN
ncbi:hypothetical protein VNO80_22328 [Phaseolus coccineus]|uniref:Protein kinase domain-containing protein n=1 Tax=Phaseolus coccineus TaxID=3886 RepID=A0AAN9M4W5_PHACN